MDQDHSTSGPGKPLHLLTPDELRKMYPPQGAPRRLSAEELEDLRRRLNADPDAPLSEAEQAGYYELGIVRYAQDVDALVAQIPEALDTPSEATTRPYAEGILDAVKWARGEQEQRRAPVTGRTPRGRLPSTAEMNREASDAVEVLYGRAASGHSQSYVVGVETTLLWLTCSSPAHPWR